jgi:hypothetical protein
MMYDQNLKGRYLFGEICATMPTRRSFNYKRGELFWIGLGIGDLKTIFSGCVDGKRITLI